VKVHHVQSLAALWFALASLCLAQEDPSPKNASAAVLQAFETHDIVMLGEIHGNKQEYEWLQSLAANPEFADRVDDIVLEIGNSLYQKSVDRYIAGEAVPIEKVQRAWRNTLGLGPPPPIYADLYKTVRETNIRRHGKHQMRVICGDPYINWDKIKTKEDIGPFMGHRDLWYAQVVKDEVLAKHHRAFLIAGVTHFLRGQGDANPPRDVQQNHGKQHNNWSNPGYIEPELRRAGAKTFLILAGTNAVKGYDDLDSRFNSWPAPSIALLNGNWVGELSAMPVVTGGTGEIQPPIKLKDAADALLYLGPRDSLIRVSAARAEVDGTLYEKELLQRMKTLGFYPFIPESKESSQFSAQFTRPKSDNGPPPTFPAPPKNMDAPLPPRPPGQ
jgi:hypothetical protein